MASPVSVAPMSTGSQSSIPSPNASRSCSPPSSRHISIKEARSKLSAEMPQWDLGDVWAVHDDEIAMNASQEICMFGMSDDEHSELENEASVSVGPGGKEERIVASAMTRGGIGAFVADHWEEQPPPSSPLLGTSRAPLLSSSPLIQQLNPFQKNHDTFAVSPFSLPNSPPSSADPTTQLMIRMGTLVCELQKDMALPAMVSSTIKLDDLVSTLNSYVCGSRSVH